ncbi:hypothetical protein P8C59_007253 [Phyllachora maydis]|uniref:Carboxylic ester hydrolase n=1 Tax=Phyllachora maydis TaxID=1825666 RepID=A0AAD9MHX1_9PEZI|nr:hypothetical protein P8C59_007253 [Phyllachora maydis]
MIGSGQWIWIVKAHLGDDHTFPERALHGAVVRLVRRESCDASAERSSTPIVNIGNPPATIVGSTNALYVGLAFPCLGVLGGTIESFKGIPFAQPPVGPLRFKPPRPLVQPLGRVDATTSTPVACPQMLLGRQTDIANMPPLLTAAIDLIANSPLFKTVADGKEDCLTINVQRPVGTKAGDKLPVLFWIFGGGFELGGTAMYDGGNVLSTAISAGKPIVFVAVNYRVSGFGFLGGKEILKDGSANLGLQDQRLGLQWVADNIEAFGGDPERVTIWGESAGAISVFDQLLLYNGNITYKGKPLFRGAIMNSGSIVPTDRVDCPKAQAVYDTVVRNAGCSGAPDTLNCLRQVDYNKLLDAVNSVPGIISYSAVALNYLPRPDGSVLAVSPEAVAATGNLAAIPFIIGDQMDEGTLFALFQSNISTTQQVQDYLAKYYFTNTKPEVISQLVSLYPENATAGSPFGTGTDNNVYPQFKRLAALLGDATFTLARRGVLNITSALQPKVPRWSYLSTYFAGTPLLGTFHGSDLLQTFFGIPPNYAARATLGYYLNFVYNLDPNDDSGGLHNASGKMALPHWPRWSEGRMLMNFEASSAHLVADDFRSEAAEFFLLNALNLHF